MSPIHSTTGGGGFFAIAAISILVLTSAPLFAEPPELEAELVIFVFGPDGKPLREVDLRVEQIGTDHPGGSQSPSEDHVSGGHRVRVDYGGKYVVSAEHSGLMPAVEIVGPIASDSGWIKLQLEERSRIVGRIVDFDPALRGQISVEAYDSKLEPEAREARIHTRITEHGRFAFDSLTSGRWTVEAFLHSGRARDSREVEITAPGQERQIELQLKGRGEAPAGQVEGGTVLDGQVLDGQVLDGQVPDGQVLHGQVLQNGAPAAGVKITGFSRTGGTNQVRTDLHGRFALPAPESGPVKIVARGPWDFYYWQTEPRDGEQITISITTSELSGVVRTHDGQPAVGARVRLTAEGEQNHRRLEVDQQGRFRHRALPHGRYSLLARTEKASARATVQMDSPQRDLELRLEPDVRQELHVERSDGQRVERLEVVARDAAGQIAGREKLKAVGPGLFRLEQLPAGQFRLLLLHRGSAATWLNATLPSDPIAVVLEPSSTLNIRIPALMDAFSATAGIQDKNGRFFSPRDAGGVAEQWSVSSGSLYLDQLPAGIWTVTVRAPDGRIYEKTLQIRSGENATHILE